MDETQKAALVAELQKPEYAALIEAQRYQELAAMLNEKPLVDNPTPQPNRPKRMTWDAFVGALAPVDVLKLYQYGNLANDLKAAILTGNDAERNAIWRGLKTQLTPGSIAALEAEFGKQEPDPNHASKIAGASIADGLGVGTIRPSDLQSLDAQRAAA